MMDNPTFDMVIPNSMAAHAAASKETKTDFTNPVYEYMEEEENDYPSRLLCLQLSLSLLHLYTCTQDRLNIYRIKNYLSI